MAHLSSVVRTEHGVVLCQHLILGNNNKKQETLPDNGQYCKIAVSKLSRGLGAKAAICSA